MEGTCLNRGDLTATAAAAVCIAGASATASATTAVVVAADNFASSGVIEDKRPETGDVDNKGEQNFVCTLLRIFKKTADNSRSVLTFSHFVLLTNTTNKLARANRTHDELCCRFHQPRFDRCFQTFSLTSHM